jgi:lipopolysaccharide export system protein LptA
MESDFNSGRNEGGIKRLPLPFIVVLLATLFFCCPPPLSIAGSNSLYAASEEDGILVDADRMVLETELSRVEYIGNVTITQDDTVITADNVKVFFKENSGSESALDDDAADTIEDKIDKIIATGSVKIVTTEMVATADKAVYDLAAGSLVMTGDPATIVQGASTMRASEIEMKGTL